MKDKGIRKAPVIGFVRYSQKIKFGDRKEERDMFAPEYFEYRFEIFVKITLKSFQVQSDNNFVLLLLHSESMPPHLKKRFLELEEANSFLQNLFLKDTTEAFNEALRKSNDRVIFQDDIAISFRIDNDDAVPSDFIKNLNHFVTKAFVGYAINMSNVAVVKRVSNDCYMVEDRYYPSNPIGLAYVTSKEFYKTVMEIGSHDFINHETSLILLAKNSAVGLMTINGENAINSINSNNATECNSEEFHHYLKERKIEHLAFDCLRIFRKKNESSKFSLKETIILLLPPIFVLLIHKLRKCLAILTL